MVNFVLVNWLPPLNIGQIGAIYTDIIIKPATSPSKFTPPAILSSLVLQPKRNFLHCIKHRRRRSQLHSSRMMAGRLLIAKKEQVFVTNDYRVIHQDVHYVLLTSNWELHFSIRRLYCDGTFALISTKGSVQPVGPPCMPLSAIFMFARLRWAKKGLIEFLGTGLLDYQKFFFQGLRNQHQTEGGPHIHFAIKQWRQMRTHESHTQTWDRPGKSN